ncbi:OmpA family protein [Actinomadura sp. NPDC023710]|uniref:OmpA family protein n=1 Tax=Actinomadura sp. NPDC023710 TaxID=3158219 RepID=UPI0033EA5686
MAAWTALLMAGIVALAGCGGDEKKPRPGSQSGGTGKSAPAVGRSVPMALKGGPAHLELTALSRTSAGAVTAQMRLVNDGQAPLRPSDAFGDQSNDPDSGNVLFASGLGLLDGLGNRFYMPLQTADHACLCSDLSGTEVSPGGSADIFAVFPAPPPQVRSVTLALPTGAAVQDVPLGSGPVRPVAGQTVDPASARLAEPKILTVSSLSESDDESITEDADNRSVRLSSDVLFALNKADLTPRASALLDNLAKQVDASRGTTVTVDGYTDTSGNDAINQPLSERRAQTVTARLKQLVTRQGVAFKAAGHGSGDPVAPNDSEQGRRKNRRVTVTFARPTPPAAPPAQGRPFEYGRGVPPVLGSATFTSPEAEGLKIEVNGLHRDSSGVTALVWTVRNTGSSTIDVLSRLDRSSSVHGSFPLQRGSAAGGVLLLDPVARTRYYPLETSNGQCVCSSLRSQSGKAELAPGESFTLWGAYKVPATTSKVSVLVPWTRLNDATVSGLNVR